jgi:hypothetical protein
MKVRTGRPPHKPNAKERRQVEMLAGIGIPQLTIASIIGVGLTTLRKHFIPELQHGSDVATAKVGEFLFEKASGKKGHDHGAVTAAIFWMKARAGWKDRHDIVHQNPDGTALFEDWPDAKLAAVTRRALEVLEKKHKSEKAAA